MRISIAAGLVAAVLSFDATADLLDMSIPSIIVSAVPVLIVSEAEKGSKWSVDKLTARSHWRVTDMEKVGDTTRIRLTRVEGKEVLEVTLPTKTVSKHKLEKGCNLVIEKKSAETAVLMTSEGNPLTVLSSSDSARQHSVARSAP